MAEQIYNTEIHEKARVLVSKIMDAIEETEQNVGSVAVALRTVSFSMRENVGADVWDSLEMTVKQSFEKHGETLLKNE
jgi:hypothetical protein